MRAKNDGGTRRSARVSGVPPEETRAERRVPPQRPLLRYHGGKWRLATWIISHFPPHRIYVDAYSGAASVLLRKPRSWGEVLNDLDGEIIQLFRMVRERGPELVRALELTPFARDEYRKSFRRSRDPLEQARRTVVRSYMGFGSNAHCRLARSGFRADVKKRGSTPAQDWRNYPAALAAIIDRLRGVVVENRPALDIMRQHDSAETLHYCDPPYVHGTRTRWAGRGARSGYNHEMTDADHGAFAECARGLKGFVIVSGYASGLYEDLFAGWRRVTREARADGARKRTECLWLSPNTPEEALLI